MIANIRARKYVYEEKTSSMRSISLCFSILTLVCTSRGLQAQNLVRNPGFEIYNNAPWALLLEETVPDWYAYFTTPDYYNTELWSVGGVQDYCGTLPHSGKAMAGGYQLGYFAALQGYNREYIQGTLSEPLKPGQLYYVELYAKPMLRSPIINFGIKNIGIAVTDKHYKHYDSTARYIIEETPVAEYSSGVISDMNEWTKVAGCFVAKGGETKIIIGNFRKDEQTDTAQLPGAYGEDQFHQKMSYYLFDDILLKEMPDARIAPGDVVICRDSAVTLTAYPENAQSYLWNTGSTGQSIRTNKAGAYSVTIITAEGCTQEATARVNSKYCGPGCAALYMPNAFSPNGDGDNDFFMPMNAADISGMELSIYNRMGERVFDTMKQDGSLDGSFKGMPCDVGTYFYYLRYRNCKQEALTKKGDLLLVR